MGQSYYRPDASNLKISEINAFMDISEQFYAGQPYGRLSYPDITEQEEALLAYCMEPRDTLVSSWYYMYGGHMQYYAKVSNIYKNVDVDI